MMTDAPVMNPQMTEWDKKLVIQPSFSRPTAVYKDPASNATCTTYYDYYIIVYMYIDY